ncbi:MAG TPA: F0F1 ATP synthase subunit delta [Solimonas sp.]|nr:F0F1 ATP synthase subunit delta [Solimonas sp.]
MADISTLARPYAKAVFELAREGGKYAAWSEALKALAQLVADPKLAALAGHPSLTRAELAGALDQALRGKLAPEALSFVRLLVENGRLKVAPAIAEQYEALRAEAESRVEVQITSAATVDKQQQDQLAAAVRKRLARDVAIAWNTDPALIAGAVIRAGDLVIDGSVRGELERLQTALSK